MIGRRTRLLALGTTLVLAAALLGVVPTYADGAGPALQAVSQTKKLRRDSWKGERKRPKSTRRR